MKNLATELAELAEKMLDLGTKLEYLGGFDTVQAMRGVNLAFYSTHVKQWADEMSDKTRENP